MYDLDVISCQSWDFFHNKMNGCDISQGYLFLIEGSVTVNANFAQTVLFINTLQT
jgi:hypothetical protein